MTPKWRYVIMVQAMGVARCGTGLKRVTLICMDTGRDLLPVGIGVGAMVGDVVGSLVGWSVGWGVGGGTIHTKGGIQV